MYNSTKKLFNEIFVWDNLLTWGPPDYGDSNQINRYQKAGINLVNLSVCLFGQPSAGFALKRIAALKGEINKYDNMMLCKTVNDILNAKSAGKIALILNFQETLPFEDDINLISVFYELGIRQALLVYNIKNCVGGGCADPTDRGLSHFGRRVIKKMNRVGMIIDGSHSSYRTTMEAMEICDGPFIFSHSNAYAVFPHYRNIRDDQIKACAKTGGVIGINGVGEFLDDIDATSESMFRHLDYMVQLVGPEHVGIGLDFVLDYKKFWLSVMPETDTWPTLPGKKRIITKFAAPEQLIEITEHMLKKGYKESDIKKILGENFSRVARQVWK